MTDLNTFNAVLMFTWSHSLPRNKMFWKKENDTGIPIIYEVMSRANIETITKYIHFTDKEHLNTAKKFAKMCILYDVANKNI